jgi:hypothetical protein
MRIVHLIPDFGLSGIQQGGYVLAAALLWRGHRKRRNANVSTPMGRNTR